MIHCYVFLVPIDRIDIITSQFGPDTFKYVGISFTTDRIVNSALVQYHTA